MIGCFLNLVRVRLRYEGLISFREWLLVVRSRVLQTMARSEIPYEMLQHELRGRRHKTAELRVILGVAHSRARS